MSAVAEILAELERALDEERDAIRRLDGAGVARCAETKRALADALAAAAPAELAAHRDALARLRPALRHNGVLLAHARACLRELAGVAASPAAGAGRVRAAL